MQNQINLELPYPPSINHYYKKNKFGGFYIGRVGKKYRSDVSYKIIKISNIKIQSKVELIVDIYPPDRRRRDIDNILKCLFDAIQDSGIIKDDSQIYKLILTRMNETLNKIVITISY